MRTQSPSQPMTWAARGMMGCGGLVFVLLGLPFVWMLLGAPTLLLLRSQAWPQASCEVLYTGIQRGESGKGGWTYRPLVAYAYQLEGREHISALFEVQPRNYKTEEEAKAQAAGFAVGSRWKCYVDPSDARQAVLLRRFNPGTLLGLVPGLFPLVGLLVMYFAAFGGRGDGARPAAQAATWLPAAAAPSGDAIGVQAVVLTPATTPLRTFAGLVITNLFWNGITGAFMYLGWHEGGLRSFEPGMLCFLPFPLIGLLLLFSIPYQFLALFNPRPYLTLSRAALHAGESLTLKYELKPFGFRVRRLRVSLTGSEQGALGRQAGKGTGHVFFTQTLVDQDRGDETHAGQLMLTIPEGVMHSFEGNLYKVLWRIKLEADIPLFPDVVQEFTLSVLPGGRM